jgi:hypothetical protein
LGWEIDAKFRKKNQNNAPLVKTVCSCGTTEGVAEMINKCPFELNSYSTV